MDDLHAYLTCPQERQREQIPDCSGNDRFPAVTCWLLGTRPPKFESKFKLFRPPLDEPIWPASALPLSGSAMRISDWRCRFPIGMQFAPIRGTSEAITARDARPGFGFATRWWLSFTMDHEASSSSQNNLHSRTQFGPPYPHRWKKILNWGHSKERRFTMWNPTHLEEIEIQKTRSTRWTTLKSTKKSTNRGLQNWAHRN